MKSVDEAYRKSVKETLAGLSVSNKGLSKSEAENRLKEFGRNELSAGKKVNPLKLFLSQFNDVLVIVLIIAALVSLGISFINSHHEYEAASEKEKETFVSTVCGTNTLLACEEIVRYQDGEELLCNASSECFLKSDIADNPEENEGLTESLLIFAIVIAIAIIGFLNEFKAEKTVEALKKLVGHSAKVRRDDKVIEIDAVEIVPGDLVLLEEGQKIPADMRLIEENQLQVNEASLTGESLPVSKNTDIVSGEVALGDQKNMVFSGTIVTTGTGVGVVVSTGSKTEIGKIADMVSEVEEEQTPMQKKLDALGKKMGALIILICIGVFAIIFFVDTEIANQPVAQRLVFAFTVAVALAVAAIPEGLSFVVRISLALGARRMAAKDALVRKLSAVEALGSTDVICSDKTGTLTKGEMTVRQIYTNGLDIEVSGSGYGFEGEFTEGGKTLKDNKKIEPILRVGMLCNNSQIKEGKVVGDPTEGSLIVSAEKGHLTHKVQNEKFPRVEEMAFTSERKMMSTVHKLAKGYLVASKGAPDVLLEHCDRVLVGGKVKKLTPQEKKKISDKNVELAKQALRVLAFAYKETNTKPKGEKGIETGLIFVGLQGMMDPPREEVKEVMHRVHAEAGMRVLMITGDYIETAKAVAEEIGIEGEAISGSELDNMSQEEFEDKVELISVYARVNPEHKIRIVKALKKHGHQVAMTGDGVNDAPAIKAADIGIAMGINGTDAAKEAADLILLDDQFLTIIDAVEEGRGIFDNVRKFVSYLLGANIAEVLIVVGGIIFLKDPILTATQLLFINIVTDGLPAVALGSDPAEKGIMRYKPHHFQAAIIDLKVWIEMVIYGVMATVIMLFEFNAENHSKIAAVSVAFTALVTYELVRLIVLRTNYNIPWFANPWLTVAIVSSFGVLVAVLYIEPVAELFGVEPISNGNWVGIALGSLAIFIIMKLSRILLDRFLPEVRPQYGADHYEKIA